MTLVSRYRIFDEQGASLPSLPRARQSRLRAKRFCLRVAGAARARLIMRPTASRSTQKRLMSNTRGANVSRFEKVGQGAFGSCLLCARLRLVLSSCSFLSVEAFHRESTPGCHGIGEAC